MVKFLCFSLVQSDHHGFLNLTVVMRVIERFTIGKLLVVAYLYSAISTFETSGVFFEAFF